MKTHKADGMELKLKVLQANNTVAATCINILSVRLLKFYTPSNSDPNFNSTFLESYDG